MTRLFIIFVLLLNYSFAKDVKVVFSYSTPPFVFTDGSGIVITIVKEALAHKGHTVVPTFVNMGRSFEMFEHGYVDATSIIKTSSGLKAHYSDYFMQYHNAAFALKSKKNQITKFDDLQGLYVIGFQGSSKFLGEEYGKVVGSLNEKYSEMADQKQQVLMLLKGRTDLVVMDRHIFKFYKALLIDEGLVSPDIEVDMFELFPPTKYRTAFKDEKIRDDFNEGLKNLRNSGRYDEIYDYYEEKFFEIKR